MNTESQREEAWLNCLNGNFDEALSMLDALIEKDSQDLVSLRLKGNTLDLFAANADEQGHLNISRDAVQRARECYMRILSIDPKNKYAIRDLADSYKSGGALHQAEEYYRRLLELLNDELQDDREEREEVLVELAAIAN